MRRGDRRDLHPAGPAGAANLARQGGSGLCLWRAVSRAAGLRNRQSRSGPDRPPAASRILCRTV